MAESDSEERIQAEKSQGIEQGIQARSPQPDQRIQADEPLPLPPLEIGAAKRPLNAKSNRLLWWLAALGAFIGFFGTTFDASEKPFARQYEWLGVGIGRGNKFIQGIEKTITVRHFGLLVFAVRGDEITVPADGLHWDDSSNQFISPTEELIDRGHRKTAQRVSRQAWLYRIGLTLAWAGLGALLGLGMRKTGSWINSLNW